MAKPGKEKRWPTKANFRNGILCTRYYPPVLAFHDLGVMNYVFNFFMDMSIHNSIRAVIIHDYFACHTAYSDNMRGILSSSSDPALIRVWRIIINIY